MKKLLLVAAVLLSSSAMADTIRTSDGISCSFDADDNPYSVEAYTESNTNDSNSYYNDSRNNADQDDMKVGLKFKYVFGGPKRLDCGKLYNLELRTKAARVKQLEEKLKALEAVNQVNW